MKVVMPFNYIDDYFWHRYKDQILPIAERVDEFTIVAYVGRKPVASEVPVIMYDREYGPNDKAEMLRRKVLMTSGLTLFRKINRRREVAMQWRNLDYDVIYCLSAGAIQQMLHLYMKDARPSSKLVHRMRGDGEEHRSHLMRQPHRWVHNRIAAYTLNKYDRHIPINKGMKQKLLNSGIPEDQVSAPIGLGVDTEQFKPAYHDHDRLTCGYFGRMSREKGIDFLFQLMRRTPEIDFVLLGKRVDRLPPLPFNCMDLGYVQHHRMPEMYGKVDLVLLPSYMEGVSNIFPEAYASGKPMLCTPQARDESLPLYGYEATHDLDEWRRLLNTVTVDRLREMGQAARRWALGYTWDSFGELIVKELMKA